MKNPKAYVMPFLIIQTLTAAKINKQFSLTKASETKTFFQMQASQKLSEIGRKWSEVLNGISEKFSAITGKTNEDDLQTANFEEMSNEMQDLNAQKAAATAQQQAEENAVKTQSLAKENPLDMLIKMLETQVKAIIADIEGWQKILDDATKGGS